MPRDYLTLGPTPAEENCAQIGAPNYRVLAAKEGRAYINQLKRLFPDLPLGVNLCVKFHPHDFGTYAEVAVTYDEGDQAQVGAALNIENHLPSEWDDAARAEMGMLTQLADLKGGERMKRTGLDAEWVVTSMQGDSQADTLCVRLDTGCATWIPNSEKVLRAKTEVPQTV